MLLASLPYMTVPGLLCKIAPNRIPHVARTFSNCENFEFISGQDYVYDGYGWQEFSRFGETLLDRCELGGALYQAAGIHCTTALPNIESEDSEAVRALVTHTASQLGIEASSP